MLWLIASRQVLATRESTPPNPAAPLLRLNFDAIPAANFDARSALRFDIDELVVPIMGIDLDCARVAVAFDLDAPAIGPFDFEDFFLVLAAEGDRSDERQNAEGQRERGDEFFELHGLFRWCDLRAGRHIVAEVAPGQRKQRAKVENV
jgi:hypothetical protein